MDLVDQVDVSDVEAEAVSAMEAYKKHMPLSTQINEINRVLRYWKRQKVSVERSERITSLTGQLEALTEAQTGVKEKRVTTPVRLLKTSKTTTSKRSRSGAKPKRREWYTVFN